MAEKHVNGEGKVVEAPLKAKNAYRTLPLAEDTVSVLLEQKEKAGSSPWVFPSPNGGPILPGQRAPPRRRQLHIPRPVPSGQGSLIPWLLLSLRNPLRWACAGFWKSRPPACWATSPPGSLWIPTPM